MEPIEAPTEWSSIKKIFFRFFFILFISFIIIHNNGAYPFWGYVMTYPTEWLHLFIPWVGKHILSLSYEITVFTNGSGDTTYDWVIVFCNAVIAFSGSLLWSLLDRNRKDYQTLHYWLTVAVRYYVGLMLINYGLVKVIQLQFPPPNIYRLTELYGDSSPMGLAWTFLGFSQGYNLFMGLAEVSAVLLMFRRTMTLGCIITLMTTSNVMAVNYFYDVPVKILSTALVMMTLFLLSNDAERLFRFFLTGQSVSLPVIPAPEFKRKWLRIAKMTFKTLLIANALGYGFYETMESRKVWGDLAPKPVLHGLYDVNHHIINGDTLKSGPAKWSQFIIEYNGYARARHSTDSTTRFLTDIDTVKHSLLFIYRGDTTRNFPFLYERPAPDKLILNGRMRKDSVSIQMTRRDLKQFQLLGRGFHWVSEYPFNR